ncbi:MAG: AI-2E family transporter [Brotaphodocola sp.]
MYKGSTNQEAGESMGKPEKKLKRMLLILGITAAVYGVFRYLLPLVIPFLLSWGLAAVLRPSAQWISNKSRIIVRGRERGIPIGVVGMMELLLLCVILSVSIYASGRKFFEELRLLTDHIPFWIEQLDIWLTGICHQLEFGMCLRKDELVHLTQEMLRAVLHTVKSAAMPYLMTNSVSVVRRGIRAAVLVVLVFIATGLVLQEMPVWKKRCLRSYFAEEFEQIGRRLFLVLRAYLKTQVVIMILTACICMAGFRIMKNPYYILAGLAVGILDALPILGTGTVLIPWAVLLFFRKQWVQGAVLLAIYLTCYCLREYLEAKWMGEQVGLSPLENLIAIYVGIQLFGISGVVLGPVGVLIIGDLVEAFPSLK